MYSPRLLIATLGMFAGCGTSATMSVNEVRTAAYPPREPSCALEFVKADFGDVGPGKSWELVGHVVIGEPGIQDPFAERYRSVVRGRACAMGGEAVAILMSATNETLMASGSSTDYAILRRPPPPGQSTAQRF